MKKEKQIMRAFLPVVVVLGLAGVASAIPTPSQNIATRHNLGGLQTLRGMRVQLVANTPINFEQEIKNAGFPAGAAVGRRWYLVRACDTVLPAALVCSGVGINEADINGCDTVEVETMNAVSNGESIRYLIRTDLTASDEYGGTERDFTWISSPSAVKVCLSWGS